MVFGRRKKKAIKEADERGRKTNETVYVVQHKKEFIVGIRSELKKLDKRVRKSAGIQRKDKKVWDYRNAIIYKTK